MSVIKSVIASTGAYLPEKVMTNADMEKIVDTTDEWITQRSGIKERRIAADGADQPVPHAAANLHTVDGIAQGRFSLPHGL